MYIFDNPTTLTAYNYKLYIYCSSVELTPEYGLSVQKGKISSPSKYYDKDLNLHPGSFSGLGRFVRLFSYFFPRSDWPNIPLSLLLSDWPNVPLSLLLS